MYSKVYRRYTPMFFPFTVNFHFDTKNNFNHFDLLRFVSFINVSGLNVGWQKGSEAREIPVMDRLIGRDLPIL